jgi:hypothetical protein
VITAHLPSGYVLGRVLDQRPSPAPLVLPAAVIGGVLPDFDLIWFYLIDDRSFHHHRYWVHIPAFWAMVATVVLPLIAWLNRRYLIAATAFFAAILLHIFLDTIAGGVLWGWPFADNLTHFVTVTPRFDNWVLNFIFHPVFVLELLIWAAAFFLYRKRSI